MGEKKEKDILKLLSAPKVPPKLTSRRIGIHTSTAGGVEKAAERAYRLGCNTFQIFSSSPRQWAPYELGRAQCEEMSRLRERYNLKPLVIHANYLVNLAGGNSEFHAKSITAFRGEVERALALCAEFLVVHPGSFRGSSREEGLRRAALAIEQAADGLNIWSSGFRILIENTAGSEFSSAATSIRWPSCFTCCGATFPSGPASTPVTRTSPDTTSSARRDLPTRSISLIAPSG